MHNINYYLLILFLWHVNFAVTPAIAVHAPPAHMEDASTSGTLDVVCSADTQATALLVRSVLTRSANTDMGRTSAFIAAIREAVHARPVRTDDVKSKDISG